MFLNVDKFPDGNIGFEWIPGNLCIMRKILRIKLI